MLKTFAIVTFVRGKHNLIYDTACVILFVKGGNKFLIVNNEIMEGDRATYSHVTVLKSIEIGLL